MSILKHELYESVRKNEFFFGKKPILIFNETSQKIGNFEINYNSVRTQLMRIINKQYPSDIKSFDEIPDE